MSGGQRAGEAPAAARAFRRAVFFIAGFDPIGPKYLYWLFRRDFGRANALEGRTALVDRMVTDADGLAGWKIETAEGDRPVSVDYAVMSPRKVILDHYYSRNVFGLIWAWLVSIHSLIVSGGYRRVLRLPLRPLLLTHYIILAIPGFLWVGSELAYWPMRLLPGGTPEWALAAARIAGALAFLQALILLERVTWLYFFVSALRLAALQGRDRAPALDRMVDDWIRIVAQRQARHDYDEVLVVGHSIGSIQGIEMVARLLKHPAIAGTGKLSLLTLGSADMILSYQSYARRFRDAIADVATAPGLVWVEYYAPTDAICRGARDPVAAAEIDLGGRGQTGPAMRRLDLREMYTPASFNRLPVNLVKQHLLYLSSGDKRASYSYYRLVCQAQRLS
jgi:hypothetical protein